MPVGYIRDTLPTADRADGGTRPARPLRRRADQRVHPVAPSTVRHVRSRDPEARDEAPAETPPLRIRPRLADPAPVAADGPARKRSRRPLTAGPSTSSIPTASGSSTAYARAERSLAKATARRENESRTMALAKAPTRPQTTDYAEERVALDKTKLRMSIRPKLITQEGHKDRSDEELRPSYGGPLAIAEFERMKTETERLKQVCCLLLPT